MRLASSSGSAPAPRAAKPRQMPDVASGASRHPESMLDWVGMGSIRQPLRIRDGEAAREADARVQLYVNLADAQAKGIHMSRLYLILDEHSATRPLTPAGLKLLLASLLQSHRDLSDRALVDFAFDYPLRRRALVSEHAGWNSYPARIRGTAAPGAGADIELGIGVWYSSTCPASAALSRQLVQHRFEHDFGAAGQVAAADVLAWLGTEQAMAGTPHAQRSFAQVRARIDDTLPSFPITALIDAIEYTLQTPVQTAVKREDEQEFARRNAANLMFCEDAGRRLKAMLDAHESVRDFHVRIEHHESLHAHDAVAVFAKGVPGGYRAAP